MEHSAIYGHILDWIQQGIVKLNEDTTMPESCMLSPVDLTSYQSAWTKHIGHERQSLSELSKRLANVAKQARDNVAQFACEDTGGYSSYSDYSEEETDSSEEEEDAQGEDEQPSKRDDALKRK